MRGIYFAIETWIVAETLGISVSNWRYIRYGIGLFVKPAYKLSINEIYFASLAMGIGLVLLYTSCVDLNWGLV